ncbi:uncharacterized protein EDB93DRAFT_780763 [Suillus bovinus]|uniref:uncharacterized protein n=1 Tax=Suillus bovinus TaxID=48563 RepID=UPI001B8713DD|nr:uncharacterized protein EDB93DRAFT_780763 [Suillus bovinus]KAG2136501.1 hypothetical protein EDB93DRAFT_780763 [Suillus bovinus]
MNQSATHASSSNGSNYSNGAQYMPNTGMYMGQFHWPQPACILHSGYAPAHPHNPYGVPVNGTHGSYAPVTRSPGVGARVSHHAFQPGQNGCHPPAVANVSCATHVGPYPQHPSAPFLHHQPFPSTSLPGVANPYIPPIPHRGCHHRHHGTGIAAGSASSSLPRVPKRTAEDLDRVIKRRKVVPGGMKNDPLFVSFLFTS